MRLKESHRLFAERFCQFSLSMVLLPSLMALGEAYHWFLELNAHFRVQAVLAAACIAIALALLKSWRSCVIAVLLVCLNGGFIGYAHLQSRQIEPSLPRANLVKVIQFNMNLFHDDPRGLAQTLLEEQADLIVLQELTPAAAVIINDALQNDFPHSISLPRQHAFGMAVFSRFALAEQQRWSPTGLDAASFRFVVYTDALGEISIVAIHPPPPMNGRLAGYRNDEVMQAAEWLAEQPSPRLLMGDLNLSPYSVWFQRLVEIGGIKPPRKLVPFTNVTWPDIWHLLPFSIPIDHIMISEDLDFSSWRAEYGYGSDHAMLIADIY